MRNLTEHSKKQLIDELTQLQQQMATLEKSKAERRQAEKALRMSEQEKRLILDHMAEHVIFYDSGMRVRWANKSAVESTGLPLKQIVGKHCYRVWHHRSEPCIGCPVEMVLKTGHPQETETTAPNGKVGLMKAYPVRNESGEVEGAVEITLEITARKKAEEKLKASLEEKEVLLKEIHHRVKNNLQIISSLLSLQSHQLKDEQALQLLRDSQDRVRSMALIHQKLYQSDDLAQIDFNQYVRELTNAVFRSYGAHPEKVKLTVDVKDVHLTVDKAVPCGLIVNELVSNALKYAFPASWKKKGQINISLRPFGEDEIELVVRDNGTGIQKDLDIHQTKSLGLRLVTILTEEQLNGTVELDRKEGTKFSIRFKNPETISPE